VPGQNHDHLRDDENGQKRWKEPIDVSRQAQVLLADDHLCVRVQGVHPDSNCNQRRDWMPPEGEYGSSDSDRHNNE
jgi:hypothetical protein